MSCLEGTRVQILKEINDWIGSDDPNTPRVFWMNGMAGLGKSTIARTIAESAEKRGILGASFFFSRNNEELRNPRLVIPTLVHQLAFFRDGVFMSLVGRALESKADSAARDIQTQFKDRRCF